MLGGIAEKSLNQAMSLWGINFLFRPLSLVLIGMICLTIGYAIYKGRKANQQTRVEAAHE